MDDKNNYPVINTNNTEKRKRKSELVPSPKGKRTILHDNHTKKIMHRDVERLRRQEMTTICTSLRNLLPLEYIKGKRSISDHMQEAVKYIKDLENRIKELGVQREVLKYPSNLRVVGNSNNNNFSPACAILVRSCLAGVEVIVNTDAEKQAVHLSRLLELLVVEGLNVVNCVSTKVNQRLMFTILSEAAGESREIDTLRLQNKLTEAIQLVNDIQ